MNRSRYPFMHLPGLSRGVQKLKQRSGSAVTNESQLILYYTRHYMKYNMEQNDTACIERQHL